MAALQETARSFASQLGQVDGMIQSTARDVAENVRELRRDMVSVADFQRLVHRIREIEGELIEEGSDDDGEYEEHTGYTDHGTEDEESDFDGDAFED